MSHSAARTVKCVSYILLGSVFVFVTWWMYGEASALSAAQRWRCVEGTLEQYSEQWEAESGSSSGAASGRGAGDKRKGPVVVASYSFAIEQGGEVRTYRGDRVRWREDHALTSEEIKALRRAWNGTRAVIVRVHPTDPNQSFIAVHDLTLESILAWVVTAVCALIVLGCVWELIFWRTGWIGAEGFNCDEDSCWERGGNWGE